MRLDVWCMSAPCQPCSQALTGQGLGSKDGRTLLHVLGLLEVFRVPAVCFEQVQGFAKHPQYPYLKAIWESLGYKLV